MKHGWVLPGLVKVAHSPERVVDRLLAQRLQRRQEEIERRHQRLRTVRDRLLRFAITRELVLNKCCLFIYLFFSTLLYFRFCLLSLFFRVVNAASTSSASPPIFQYRYLQAVLFKLSCPTSYCTSGCWSTYELLLLTQLHVNSVLYINHEFVAVGSVLLTKGDY
jgi:hypothetical protein